MRLAVCLVAALVTVFCVIGFWILTEPPMYYARDALSPAVHIVPPPPLTQPQRARCGVYVTMSGLSQQPPQTGLCRLCYNGGA